MAETVFDKVLTDQDVVNDLTSTETDKPLAAAQGKALNEAITAIVLREIKPYLFDSSGEAVIEKSGYTPISVVAPNEWTAIAIQYFAYTQGRASVKKSEWANTTHTLDVVFVKWG